MQNGVPQNPGELNKRVETLADNLKKQGFWFSPLTISISQSFAYPDKVRGSKRLEISLIVSADFTADRLMALVFFALELAFTGTLFSLSVSQIKFNFLK